MTNEAISFETPGGPVSIPAQPVAQAPAQPVPAPLGMQPPVRVLPAEPAIEHPAQSVAPATGIQPAQATPQVAPPAPGAGVPVDPNAERDEIEAQLDVLISQTFEPQFRVQSPAIQAQVQRRIAELSERLHPDTGDATGRGNPRGMVASSQPHDLLP